ncbi:hypothetical protein MKJ01_06355 [Chryseobacterium sp. SSA4.19]|uniref:hypothetical protein n=1 Tax=Chryseobacterium sp. SSA4.19 TaxID=2919915 RepID=UPI001F4E7956|nr:hypothetical protein [Chryseobacterium sp. SSA4.19]MCJ8153383.1 hypothetical protein [Chryseobacterium sp. SSA4.19]
MKTTALILGILSLFVFSSCKCDFDEDEPENKYNKDEKFNNERRTDDIVLNDTVRIK